MQKRNQTLRASTGLVAALLGVALVAGCTPAHFLPGGNPAAPSQASSGSSNSPSNGNQTTTTQAAPLVIQGTASLNGTALANAQVTVYNALTNAPVAFSAGAASVVAAGGGNVVAAGGGNYRVTQASPTTDAQGNFNLQVSGVDSTTPVRIVVSGGGSTLTALIVQSSRTVLAQTYSAVAVNATSTVLDAVARNYINLFKAAGVPANSPLYQTLSKNLAAMQTKLTTYYENNPAAAAAVASGKPDTPNDASPIGDASGINRDLVDAGLSDSLNSALIVALKEVQINSETLAVVNSTVNDLGFPGTTVKLSVNGSQLTVTDSNGVPVTSINLADNSLATSDLTGTLQAGVGNATGTVTTSSSFNPTISISAASNALTITVNQSGEKIARVVARIAQSDCTLGSLTGSLITSGTATVAGVNRTLTMVQGGTASSFTAPVYLGLAQLSTALWNGELDAGGAKVADFAVYKDSTYYYLVTTYVVNTAILTTSTNTTLVTNANAFSSITTGKTVSFTMTSTEGNEVDSTQKIQ